MVRVLSLISSLFAAAFVIFVVIGLAVIGGPLAADEPLTAGCPVQGGCGPPPGPCKVLYTGCCQDELGYEECCWPCDNPDVGDGCVCNESECPFP